METTMTGVQRRKKILEMLGQSSTPLSGGALGRAVGVSRQVVVQDIALLRTEGHPVLATARGYVLEVPHQTERLFKMCHTTEQTREELNTIVDLGGEVLDVRVRRQSGRFRPGSEKNRIRTSGGWQRRVPGAR